MHDKHADGGALIQQAEQFASELDQLLDENPGQALEKVLRAPAEIATQPQVRLLAGIARSLVDGPNAARSELERLALERPDMADARHALGRIYESCGETSRTVTEYLAAWQLDAAADEQHGFDLADVNEHILSVAREVVGELSDELRSRLAKVPIVIEARPDRHLVEQGFDPRSVGLFEGPDHREQVWDVPTLLPRIVIYAANLLASVDLDDADELQRQIEITLLHEIGHFFGMDEDQLHELGLG